MPRRYASCTTYIALPPSGLVHYEARSMAHLLQQVGVAPDTPYFLEPIRRHPNASPAATLAADTLALTLTLPPDTPRRWHGAVGLRVLRALGFVATAAALDDTLVFTTVGADATRRVVDAIQGARDAMVD